MSAENPLPSTPRPPGHLPALTPGPIATATQHVCFICLLNDAETPDARWVNPCPCTLEAHEECMLQWVAETEQSAARASKGSGLRCPACNGRIRVDEPFDPIVYLRDRLHRAYSRSSPLVLLMLVVSGGVAGSGWYGLTAAHVFAGPDSTARWLGLRGLAGRRPDVPLWRWPPFWSLNAKIWALSLIGPGLTICRALPPIGNLIMVPASLLSGAVLVAKDDMPTWPPSPTWAMTLFPFVQLTYTNIYYEFFGGLEKRLNRALRGRPAEDQQPRPAREQQQQQQARDREEGEDGLWGALGGLGHAVIGILGDDNEIVLEAEVRMGEPDDVQLGEVDEAEVEEELAELEREVEAREAEEQLRADHVIQLDIEADNNNQTARVDGGDDNSHGDVQEVGQEATGETREGRPVAPQPAYDHPTDEEQRQPQLAAVVRDQDVQNQARNNVNGNNANNNNVQEQPPAAGGGGGGDDNRAANTTLTDIVNSVVASLLYPTVCFGVGELLRLTLPRPWVTRPAWGRPTGLLQERWGRSLAGGCLYTVLKDAFVLYAKYRRVQVKKSRKVRNVERRR